MMELSPKERAALNILKESSSYENYFFSKVSDIKWFSYLEENGYFLASKAPRPLSADQEGYFTIPEWNVLPYLERVSEQVNVPGNEQYIDELLSIISNVSNHKDSEGNPIDNYRTWYYFTKILLNIPTERIPKEEIVGLIPYWLKSKFNTMLQGSHIASKLLPKFLESENEEDWKKAEKIVDAVTEIKWMPKEKREEATTVVDTYRLVEAFKKHGLEVGEKCSPNLIHVIANRIKEIIEKKESRKESDKGVVRDFSYIWFSSLYSSPLDMHISSADQVLVFILKEIQSGKSLSNPAETREVLDKFLGEEYAFHIFRRLVLFIVGKQWEDYKDFFFRILDSEPNIFDSSYYSPELSQLLKSNSDKFTRDEKAAIKEKILAGPERSLEEKDEEECKAAWKQKWLYILKDDEYFRPHYEEQKKISGYEKEKFVYDSAIKVSSKSDKSPLTSDEILELTNEELAERLKEFKSKDRWEGPNIDGLAGALKDAVASTPEKFTADLTPFEGLGYIYVYKILDGIVNAWNEKKNIDWHNIFQFVNSYIHEDAFWNDEIVVEKGEWLGGATHEWVVSMIAELVQAGSKDDAWAFPEKYIGDAQEIVFKLLDKSEVEEELPSGDYVTHTLNTPVGKSITALIYLALKIARDSSKKGDAQEPGWSPEYRDRYNSLLDKRHIDAYNCLGRYLPNFHYLDKNWVKTKIDDLEKEKGGSHWEAFMAGYFSQGKVYDELYIWMKPHYIYGMEHSFKDQHDNERLVQHICIGYLRGNEEIEKEGSLFKAILDDWKQEWRKNEKEKNLRYWEQINEIIEFFSMQRNHLAEDTKQNREMKGRMIEFWRWLYDQYEGDKSLIEFDKNILSNVSKLTTYLPQIDDENKEWLMLSAQHVPTAYNSPFFIEYLDELKDKGKKEETAKHIGDIFLKMLENCTPDFDKEHIRSVVEFLYKSKSEETASNICNIYGERGNDMLRDLWEKFSKK